MGLSLSPGGLCSLLLLADCSGLNEIMDEAGIKYGKCVIKLI